MQRVYFDHAATTPVHPEVIAAMLPYFHNSFGNPSSIHSFGRESRQAVDSARERVAKVLGASPREIYFTSGGTEADNIAIQGVALAKKGQGRHIITSQIEHHAVLDACKYLETQGFAVTYLPVDEYGRVRVEDVLAALRPDTILITIMHANNEVGTIQPIREISAIAREHKVTFHTDAVQTVGSIPVNVDDLGVDLLTLSAHKFYGPKGIGVLYIRKGTKLKPLYHGGGQERKFRPGTENHVGIIGLAKALEIAAADMTSKQAEVAALRDKLMAGLLEIPEVKPNGHPTERLPGNVNISIRYVEGESLILSLDMQGVAVSSGSACTSGSLDPSHVLLAMGLSHGEAHGSLRLTLGRDTTPAEVDYVLSILPPIVLRLRQMSPLFHKR
ncbi:MAG: cysteine desulfurase NifS [Firmicutes bacterium]|nr:cysteine desulfurase NifS [Dethiobacter sp.]MBS3888756.1 cysteine desulfurase NifS [Bacillota bacterium]MBS4055158.1 cysteine desulfurase NifS [Thermaerobacter sp.]